MFKSIPHYLQHTVLLVQHKYVFTANLVWFMGMTATAPWNLSWRKIGGVAATTASTVGIGLVFGWLRFFWRLLRKKGLKRLTLPRVTLYLSNKISSFQIYNIFNISYALLNIDVNIYVCIYHLIALLCHMK